jgi:cyclophilin family peptidyl-prolyl cis-trans isomerase
VPGRTITGETPCPAADGSEERATSFESAPPMCIDETATYEATISFAGKGDLKVTLDAATAPQTVNNFVVLARYHYFDDTVCHRAIPSFVVQCGDPTATGGGGPGYEFADELPAAGEYQVGSLAMANSGANTNGSQFFVITGADGAALDPNYSLFGQAAAGQEDLIAALDAAGNPDPTANGVPPLEQVVITGVTIAETAA